MKIQNTTKICNELIKAIAIDAGLDLRENAILEVEYSTGINQGLHNDDLGGFYSYVFEGTKHYVIKMAAIAGTEILAHELRHAYQNQAMGDEAMMSINAVELEHVGYWDNILEIDAREFGTKWLKLTKRA